jgi:predicted lipoprotein
VLNETYINNLDDALKGFHPAEYLLYGLNGTKTHVDFTAREFEYLEALTLNLRNLTAQLALGWNPALPTSFYNEFSMAGIGSTVFTTRKSAFEEMVSSMAGICDEVANGKINEPFVAQDPTLEESPFSQNSLIDFTNNIKGVQNVYLGKYIVDGAGLENFVRNHNLSLDATIKLQINNAITALNNITEPFGTAIISQPVQVQNAVDAINILKDTIEGELLPLVQLHVN